MATLRTFISGAVRGRSVLSKFQTPTRIQRVHSHDEGPPQPYENLPFTISNRYTTTLKWCLFFGSGLWAPFIIVWYSMAKRTMISLDLIVLLFAL
ncbi:cytochrome c oxidase subunit 7C, mitochondrial-like [Hyposmocoma kahamanoa]|uniref:cytochrome c oxidase subunit 7C, mitochondrial-like n=1 Tax=Hyposmocoma kahamanoa TaxID=1477025 RepID=UPI000E6D8903|nr:cytochrome c oxidase subunit 7C, mitochondrial-like [Hyposmocoma kahamanoa]